MGTRYAWKIDNKGVHIVPNVTNVPRISGLHYDRCSLHKGMSVMFKYTVGFKYDCNLGFSKVHR